MGSAHDDELWYGQQARLKEQGVKLDSLGRRNNGWTINKLGRGGPVKQYDTRQSIAISSEEWDKVKAVAARDGVSASEKVRQYIEWGIENDE
jgi:hypothetical protein